MCKIQITIVILCLLYVTSFATEEAEKPVKLPNKPVQKRGLVREHPTYSSIIAENKKYCSLVDEKHFASETLGFVTPWNNRGYDIAKIFKKKFDYISPTWFTINVENGVAVIKGDHNIDKGWVRDVKANSNTKILPRFTPDGQEAYSAIIDWEKGIPLVEQMVEIVRENKFDGLILDTGFLGLRVPQMEFYNSLLAVLKKLSQDLHRNKLLLFLVEPPLLDDTNPNSPKNTFGAYEFELIMDYVDRFVLMTYDFSSNRGIVGPNAPLPWVTKTVLTILSPEVRSKKEVTEKLLMGMPFFGYSYQSGQRPSAVLGPQFIKLLEAQKPELTYDATSVEHSFTLSNGIQIQYPTLYSVSRRLQLAEELGIGVAIWEIGQGLDYFYDLL